MRRLLSAGVALGVLAATAQAQLTFKAYSQPAPPGIQDRPTDLSLAVSHDRIVLVGNDRWHIADKTGNPRITVGTGLATPLPFINKLPGSSEPFDPRAEYDVVHDRIVIVMSERTATPIVHVMISKAGAVPDDFTDTYWHIYTGDGTVPGTAGAAFMLLRDPPSIPAGLEGLADHPTVAIDEDYLYLCIRDVTVTTPFSQWAVALPINHSGGDLYAGDRVAETEMSFIDFRNPPPAFPDPDQSNLHGSVMETTPFADDVQFFITTNDPPLTGSVVTPLQHEAIRLGALIETAPPSGGSPATFDYQFVDMAIPGVPTFFDADNHRPITPGSATVQYRAPLGSKIETAVRHRDQFGNDLIYAVHEYEADSGGSPVTDFTSRWYVIEPDLANVGTIAWTPSIIDTGVIPEPAQSQQDTFHAGIAINHLGRMGLTWTASDASIHPQMEYGIFDRVTNTFAQGVHNTGGQPPAPWVDPDGSGRWADYSDIQLDPNGCRFWAAATLIGTTPGAGSTILDRDAWIGAIPFDCFTTDMNLDGVTNAFDMMAYTDAFLSGDQRADTNGDQTIESFDMDAFATAYDAATGP